MISLRPARLLVPLALAAAVLSLLALGERSLPARAPEAREANGSEIGPDSSAADLEAARGAVLAAVNAARREARRRDLVANAALERAATGHALDMIERDFFAHESPDGATPRERAAAAGYSARAVGETIAYGQRGAAEAVADWLDSPQHRRILLEAAVTELGVGIAVGREGRGTKVVWVALVAAKR